MTQEDRMELDRKIIEQRRGVEIPRVSSPPRVGRGGGAWVSSPPPRVETPVAASTDFPEGPLPGGKWETPADQVTPSGNQRPT